MDGPWSDVVSPEIRRLRVLDCLSSLEHSSTIGNMVARRTLPWVVRSTCLRTIHCFFSGLGLPLRIYTPPVLQFFAMTRFEFDPHSSLRVMDFVSCSFHRTGVVRAALGVTFGDVPHRSLGGWKRAHSCTGVDDDLKRLLAPSFLEIVDGTQRVEPSFPNPHGVLDCSEDC